MSAALVDAQGEDPMFGQHARAAATAAVAILPLVAGCTAFDTPATYNRHRLSDITLPRSGDASAAATEIFYFDVTITPEFPDNNATAEAERMSWLDEWLEQRNMCPTGYEIIRKRRFEYMEDNPARRDLRYEVRCQAA
jgi:hypothetical protein